MSAGSYYSVEKTDLIVLAEHLRTGLAVSAGSCYSVKKTDLIVQTEYSRIGLIVVSD